MNLYLSKKLFVDLRLYARLDKVWTPSSSSITKGLLLFFLVTSVLLIIRPENELTKKVSYTKQVDITTKNQINQFLGSRNIILDFLFVPQLSQDINRLEFVQHAKVTRNELLTFELALTEFIPHAYWHTGTDRIAVDLHGNILTSFTPKQRPVIIELQEISINHLLASPNRDALLALKLIEEEPLAQELIDENVTYVFTKSEGLSAELPNGSIVVIGDSTNIDEKLIAWRIFKTQIDAADPKNPIHLDLRFKNRALISNNITTSLTVQKVLKD